MAVKILAVDDSLTMRKIMEMTFAGEDADVVTVASGAEAIAKAKEVRPDVVFADVSMEPDGYAVAQAIKSDEGLANTAVILLASQHHPYDEAKGKSVGVDDHVDKPFDSQVVIDKVAQVLSRPRAKASVAPAAATPSRTGSPVQASPSGRSPKRTMAFGSPPVRPPQPPAKPAAPARPAPPAPPAKPEPPAKPVLELADDLLDEPGVVPAPRAPAKPQPPARPAAPAKPEPPARPAAAAPKAAPAPKAPPIAAAAAAASAPLAGKLEALGLDKDQIAGVLALSREVIEQVVWEVVPDLAETLIKEEIARLTAE